MTTYGYARILRIFDEDTASYQEALDVCGWHFREATTLSRRPPRQGAHRAAKSWPMRGLPIVAVGTHVGREIVMFGVCQATQWEPFDDSGGNRYKSQIRIEWEDVIYNVPKDQYPTRPPLSNGSLTRKQHNAWRRAARPLMTALQQPLE